MQYKPQAPPTSFKKPVRRKFAEPPRSPLELHDKHSDYVTAPQAPYAFTPP